MHLTKMTPAALAGAIGLLAMTALGGCGRSEPTSSASASSAGAATAAASSAERSASEAQASAAIARAKVPAAGAVANTTGVNKTPTPSVTVAEEAAAAGDEAPQELRNKVNAAKDAGRAPTR